MRPCRVAFFCRNPLGDGVNSLVLSSAIQAAGFQIDTYHNTLGALRNWVPHLPIFPYPEEAEIPSLLERYDLLIAVWDGKTDFITRLVAEGKKRFPEKIRVIYLYSSKNIAEEPYYSDCLVNPGKSVAENYQFFCKQILHLPSAERKIPWKIPEGLIFRKYPKRIVLHPTGSGPAKGSWPKEKFVAFAMSLKELGYDVVVIPGFRDMAHWEDAPFERVDFPTFDELARYLYESGYLVGSDSGPGHLASALGIPTLTLCRRKTHAKLWSPSFALNVTVTPHPLIPNVRWFRLRDRRWQTFITVAQVLRGFRKLLQKERAELLSKR